MPEPRRDELGERTEQPTRLRLDEARRRGRVPRSAELTAAATVLGALIALVLLGPSLLDELTEMTATMLDGRSQTIDATAGLGRVPLGAAGGAAGVVAALLAAAAVVAVAAGVAQVGAVAAPDRVRPQWGRVGIRAGLARLLSLRTPVRAVGALAKLGVVVAVGYWTLWPALPRVAAAAGLGPGAVAAEAGSLVALMGFRLVLCLLVLGAADFGFQWWQHRRELRITRREQAEDMRRMEGDWRVRQRRRRLGRQIVEKRGGRRGDGAGPQVGGGPGSRGERLVGGVKGVRD